MENKKNNKLVIFLIIVILLLLAVIGYLYFNKNNNSSKSNNLTTNTTTKKVAYSTEITNGKLFSDINLLTNFDKKYTILLDGKTTKLELNNVYKVIKENEDPNEPDDTQSILSVKINENEIVSYTDNADFMGNSLLFYSIGIYKNKYVAIVVDKSPSNGCFIDETEIQLYNAYGYVKSYNSFVLYINGKEILMPYLDDNYVYYYAFDNNDFSIKSDFTDIYLYKVDENGNYSKIKSVGKYDCAGETE